MNADRKKKKKRKDDDPIILKELSKIAEQTLDAVMMQLMEETARWVAHKLNEDDQQYTFDQLWDPETNIRYGSWYLSFLSKRFDRGIVKVICAYHAGQGNVDAWLKNPSCSSDGITLEHIPTADTALYCKRVLAACDIYKKYYFVSPTDSL